MDKDRVLLDKSAFAYLIASMSVVLGLMIAFMRSNTTSMETVLALLRDRAELQERQDALQNSRMDALNEEITALRGRVGMLEAKVIKLESK